MKVHGAVLHNHCEKVYTATERYIFKLMCCALLYQSSILKRADTINPTHMAPLSKGENKCLFELLFVPGLPVAIIYL